MIDPLVLLGPRNTEVKVLDKNGAVVKSFRPFRKVLCQWTRLPILGDPFNIH